MAHKPTRKAAGPGPREARTPPASRRRLWLFRLGAILVGPLVFLGLLELGLRAIGYGYNPHVAIPCQVDGRPCRGENVKFGWRFFPPVLAREFEPFLFAAAKPENTCRIFVLGESAAQGAPNNAFRFGRLLEAMLQERLPDLRFEVVTAAMAAINSHVVLQIARDCARYDPDFFVVYMGNNEVVGPYGPGTVLTGTLSNLSLIRAGIRLRATKLGQLVSALGRRKLSEGGPPVWRGMAMFLGHQVRADDPAMATTYGHFQQNLQDICRLAADGGARTILCTVGANLRDCPPFASLNRADLTAQQRTDWQTAYKQGVIAETQGKDAEAIASYRKAAAIDDSHAELQFRLARCYERLEDYDNARAGYVKSLDMDTLRFRADTRINQIVRQVADRHQTQGVVLADVAREIDANSPHGLAGEELFHEHVHLTFRGNHVVARTILAQLEPQILERFPKVRPVAPVPDERWCAQRLAYNPWSRQKTLQMVVHGFLDKPPFTHQLGHTERMERLTAQLEQQQKALTPEELRSLADRYVQTIERYPDDWRLRWDYGQLLAEDLKDYDASLEQYRIVHKLLPHSHMPYDSLGSVLRAKGDLTGAIVAYEKLLAIKPTSGSACYWLGVCHNKQGRADLVEPLLRKAIRLEPDNAWAYLDLAELYYKSKRFEDAEKVCREGLAILPNNARLHGNLGLLLIRKGDRAQGAAEIRRALELDPASPEIRRLAETLLGR
ncbi:MAG: tetratricopeptide repeat protein [Phycisphaerae bacterium]|nr:tetratricopeptide repeat protein [Phycisphaerae bacterium]